MDIKQLLEKLDQFAGQAVGQKPGDQWRGIDKAPPGKKLVGDSILKDLSKGKTPKSKEQELSEEFEAFLQSLEEENLGTHPKRPGRKSDRPSRGHEPEPRYKTIKADEGATPFMPGIENTPEYKQGYATAKLPVPYPEGTQQYTNYYKGVMDKTGPQLGEAGSSAQQAAIAIAMKKAGKKPKNESAMSDLDIELQDYRSMSDKEFNAAYGISKTNWINKNKSLVIQNPKLKQALGLDEAVGQTYTVIIDRKGREKPVSGTIPELLQYFGYTLEVGKSYEHERGRYKINMNPKNVVQLVDALNKAASNGAANGAPSTYYSVGEEQVNESHYKWEITFRDGKQAVYQQNNPHYNDKTAASDIAYSVSLNPGSRVIATKDGKPFDWQSLLSEGHGGNYEGTKRRLKNSDPFVVFDKTLGAVICTSDSLDKAKKQAIEWAEYDDIDVAVIQKDTKQSVFRVNGYADAEKYLSEGWESGPEEYEEPYDDADDAYDRRRQAKIDAEAEKEWAKKPKVTTYKLSGRGPNMEPNYEFPGEYASQEEAMAAREKLMADPRTPHPEHIGIRTITRLAEHEYRGPHSNMEIDRSAPGITKVTRKNYKDHHSSRYAPEPLNVSLSDRGRTNPRLNSTGEREFDSVDEADTRQTPLVDKEDYDAKRAQLQKIQMDPDTAKDPELKAELARRMHVLMQQAKAMGIDESRAHKVLSTWFKNRELQNKFAKGELTVPTPQERKDKVEKPKKQVKEYGANQPQGTAGQTALSKPTPTDPKQAQAIAQATSALKSATQSSAPAPMIAKAIDAASQGKPVGGQDMKAIEPLMKDMATVAQDPKLASQFKTLAQQIQQAQKKTT